MEMSTAMGIRHKFKSQRSEIALTLRWCRFYLDEVYQIVEVFDDHSTAHEALHPVVWKPSVKASNRRFCSSANHAGVVGILDCAIDKRPSYIQGHCVSRQAVCRRYIAACGGHLYGASRAYAEWFPVTSRAVWTVLVECWLLSNRAVRQVLTPI